MGVTNYQYTYSDGTTGNSPWKKDANGNYALRPDGSLDEGTFDGRTMPDGSLNHATVGNADANGNVFLYDNYSTPASNYYSNANEAAWGRPSSPGQQTPNGYGYDGAMGGAVFGGTAPGYASGGTYNTKPALYNPATGGAMGGSSGGGAGGSFGGTTGRTDAGYGSGGYGASFSSSPIQNPYLDQYANALSSTMTNNFNRNQLPQIGSQFAATGGYGGSRQGVIESNALNDLNGQIGNALSGLYANGFNNQLNYNLGVMNNQLGYGNLGLGYANLDRNINNDNVSNQMMGANLGLNVFDRLMGNNQTGLNAGTNIHNTPMNYYGQFTNTANGIGNGYGTSTGSTNVNGNPMLGALGGAQLGSQISNWWNGGSGTGLTAGSSNPGSYTPGSFDYSLGSGNSGLGIKF